MYAKALSFNFNVFLIYSVKISIIVLSFYFIYSKLAYNEQLSATQFWTILNNSTILSVQNIVFLLLLSCLNWYFEIVKWNRLVSALTPISISDAAIQCVSAHTASLFTPNRIGDYGAKSLYYPKTLRTKIMALNGIGNVAQMCVTTCFGGLGLLFFYIKFPLNLQFKTVNFWPYFVLVLIGIVLLLLSTSFFHPKQWILKIKSFLKRISKPLFFKVLLFSCLRYLIFSFQFFVLLQLFQTDLGYLQCMMVVSSMYVLSSILPSVFIFDVVLKGSIAVYLFSFFDINAATVLSCITLMWLLNMVLPSVIGSYFVMHFKPKNSY